MTAPLEDPLGGAPLVRRVERHASLPSTQARALELVEGGEAAGLLVLAGTQSAGTGRHGHRWASPRGGLWMSLVVEAPRRPGLAISVVAALAGRAALRRAAGIEARLKWPNDLLAGRRKLGGVIAAERAPAAGGHPRVVLGIGIDANVRRADLPPDVAEMATSTLEETGREVSLDALARALLEELAPRLGRADAGAADLRDESFSCLVREHPVRWTSPAGERREGRVHDMQPSGALVIAPEGGRPFAVSTGDLEILWPPSP